MYKIRLRIYCFRHLEKYTRVHFFLMIQASPVCLVRNKNSVDCKFEIIGSQLAKVIFNFTVARNKDGITEVESETAS